MPALILHGAWVENRFFLWGEAAAIWKRLEQAYDRVTERALEVAFTDRQ